MRGSVKKLSKSHHSSLNELNITPLLDLVFVLLVIFIITTPQLANNLELNLPSGKPPPPSTEKPRINNLVVDAEGHIFLNDQAMNLTELRAELDRLKKAEPERGVVVRGSGAADYQHVISVLDIIQQLDITKVGLATSTAEQAAVQP